MATKSAAHPHRVDEAASDVQDVVAEREPIRGPEFVDAVGFDSSTVRSAIRQACRAGDIARRPDPTDARVRIYSLSDDGGDDD